MTDELIIRDEAVAKALCEPNYLLLLELLFHGEKSLSELAEKLELKLTTALYRVNALIKLGLAEVSREVKRSGRASKRYRAAAKTFLVPVELIPRERDELISDRLIGSIVESFQRDIALAREEEYGPRYLQISAEQRPEGLTIVNIYENGRSDEVTPTSVAVMQSVGLVRLSFAEAKAFQRDLLELFTKYVEDNGAQGQAYYFLLGLTPASGKPSPWE